MEDIKKEYIEREALRDELYFVDAITMNGVKILNQFPASDVVEVIRCEHCDLWNRWDSAGRKSLGNYVCSCAYWSNNEDGYAIYTKPDDFCSNAEPYEE